MMFPVAHNIPKSLGIGDAVLCHTLISDINEYDCCTHKNPVIPVSFLAALSITKKVYQESEVFFWGTKGRRSIVRLLLLWYRSITQTRPNANVYSVCSKIVQSILSNAPLELHTHS
jgi:hypothetical protein